MCIRDSPNTTSSRRAVCTYAFADGGRLARHGLGKRHVVIGDRREQFFFVFAVERRLQRRQRRHTTPTCSSPAFRRLGRTRPTEIYRGPARSENYLFPVFGRPGLQNGTPYGTVVLPLPTVCSVGVLWPNGWIDQDKTWYGGRPQSRRYCVRWGPSSSMERNTAPHPTFRPMSIVAKRPPSSATAELFF